MWYSTAHKASNGRRCRAKICKLMSSEAWFVSMAEEVIGDRSIIP